MHEAAFDVGAFNLSIAMRGKLGAGTPRGLADARPDKSVGFGACIAVLGGLGAVSGPWGRFSGDSRRRCEIQPARRWPRRCFSRPETGVFCHEAAKL